MNTPCTWRYRPDLQSITDSEGKESSEIISPSVSPQFQNESRGLVDPVHKSLSIKVGQ